MSLGLEPVVNSDSVEVGNWAEAGKVNELAIKIVPAAIV